MDIDTYDTVHVWLRWMLRYMIMISINDIDTWIRVYIWWCICMTGNNEYVMMDMIMVWTDMLVCNMIIRLTETDKYDLLIWVVDITGLVMAYMISEWRWTWYVMYVYGLWWTSMVLCVRPALRGNDIDNMICLMQCDMCFLCVIIWGKGFIHWASRSPPNSFSVFQVTCLLHRTQTGRLTRSSSSSRRKQHGACILYWETGALGLMCYY